MRKSVKAFTDAILDLIVEDPVIVAGRKDYMGKPEVSEYCITIRSVPQCYSTIRSSATARQMCSEYPRSGVVLTYPCRCCTSALTSK